MNTVSPSPLRQIESSVAAQAPSPPTLAGLSSALDELIKSWSRNAADDRPISLLEPTASGIEPLAYQLICSLLPALRNRQGEVEDSVDRAMLVLCSHLSTHFEKPAPCEALQTEKAPCEKIALSPWQERRAKEMMASHMDRGLSIAQIAGECSLSRSHFSRAFKKNTGVSPRDWFLQMRLDKAKHLLTETQLTISRISLDCGFADQSHFTRVFTRVIGLTPFSWRRSLPVASRRAS
ncbi:transcriptional regulator, AraC family protein [Pseudomonas sp. CFII64]|jgi:AraC family transcriptional regulator|uniref:helix-turn-helix domain-containing protein n=1 Tax=Pseudomonas sp. CFII64 TaxID=911242 RepID=UPI00035767E8|nr:AraC family transcriptional regulator [Pseudomonas sp. CFII64]EPJ80190.1 transcriptional regulator, AraC family protein [Pseudomonas sp. CFII64]